MSDTKKGAEWLTPEGRMEARDVFNDHDDGNAVRPYLDALEKAERDLAAAVRERDGEREVQFFHGELIKEGEPMQIIIKHQHTGAVLYEGDHDKLAGAVQEAARKSANLRGANLRGANLRGADLQVANLSVANLNGANLSAADLHGAHLRGTNLYRAYLQGANLQGATLSDATLQDAYLSNTNLSGANLSGANLSGANLSGANLRDADLRGADLQGAYLGGTHLGEPGATRVSWQSHALLSEILWRAADTEPQRMLAAYVGRRLDWCWEQWGRWDHPERDWALAELCRWVHAEDDPDDVPDLITTARR